MGKIIAIITLVVLLSIAGANADIVELPLAAEGEYASSETWTMDFDLGVTFLDISHVYIDWAGEITGEETMHAGVIDAQFVATLYELNPHDYFGRAYVQGGADMYPDPEPFGLQSPFNGQDWTMLLDGKASIEIWFGATSHPLDVISLSVPSGALDSATLVVEGNIIPEPATFFLLALGGLLFRNHLHKASNYNIIVSA